MLPWNGWYHVNGNTYGTWLRGDPRGWRARHHREHVDGDYKNPPPPGMYDRLHEHSKRLMKRPEVQLSPDARQLACRVMAESLRRHGVELIALCVDDHHYHLLARFPKPTDQGTGRSLDGARRLGGRSPSGKAVSLDPWVCAVEPWASAIPKRKDGNISIAIVRHLVGMAKKDSAAALRVAGLVSPGGVWAKRCRLLQVRDRSHQLNVHQYIVAHRQRGAATWAICEPRRGHGSKPTDQNREPSPHHRGSFRGG